MHHRRAASNYPVGYTKDDFRELYSQVGSDSGKGWAGYGNIVPGVWQYSSSAIVPGASSTTDVNAFRGTVEQFATRNAREENYMAWRNNKGMQVLINEIRAKNPGCVIGTIGDTRHATENPTSDHNPKLLNGAEVVNALDPMLGNGLTKAEIDEIVNTLVKKRDSRVKYIIWQRRIISGNNGPSPWVWRTYTGTSDPHTGHAHISVTDAADKDLRPWLSNPANRTVTYQHFNGALPILLQNDSDPLKKDGPYFVNRAQLALQVAADGDYGPNTADAVKDLDIEGGTGKTIGLKEYVRIHGLWGATETGSWSEDADKRTVTYTKFAAHLPVLKYGDDDSDGLFEGGTWYVSRAQRLLRVTDDGDYGPQTQAAVKKLVGSGDGKTLDLDAWIPLIGMWGAEETKITKLQRKV